MGYSIEAKDLCKSFERSVKQGKKTKKEEFLAVDHISLEAQAGEIVGILGPNGAGKTTLLRMLGTLMTPTTGEIKLTDVSGNEIEQLTEKKQAIGYLSGNTKLYPRFSIREYLHFLGELYGYSEQEMTERTKEIFDVLDMTVEEAVPFFENLPSIKRKIETLNDVGLSYIKLGQPSTTLSGGEAQRIKLATELSRRSTGKTIYILDEPTTGLHFADVHKLTEILHKLKEGGNTVVVIEHNLDVIKTADHIIDIGPEGGDNGGTIIATGTPEEVAENPKSYTGIYVKKMLERDSK